MTDQLPDPTIQLLEEEKLRIEKEKLAAEKRLIDLAISRLAEEQLTPPAQRSDEGRLKLEKDKLVRKTPGRADHCPDDAPLARSGNPHQSVRIADCFSDGPKRTKRL
jgi:hypothetical protein